MLRATKDRLWSNCKILLLSICYYQSRASYFLNGASYDSGASCLGARLMWGELSCTSGHARTVSERARIPCLGEVTCYEIITGQL